MAISPVAAADSVCGNWDDVDPADADFEAFVTVCELGYIRGNTRGNLRPDDNLTRVEAAVVLNRIFEFDEVFDPEEHEIRFNDEFFEEHIEKESHQWIFNAVHRISDVEVDGNNIFSGYLDGSFRPLSTISLVEFSKVYLMTLKDQGDARYVDYTFNLAKDPWYYDIRELLVDFNGASALQEDTYSDEYDYELNTTMGEAYLNLNSKLKRRQAIVFLAALAEQGYLTGMITFNGDYPFGFDYPPGLRTSSLNDSSVTFTASSGLVKLTGLQRLDAGKLAYSANYSGESVTVPERLKDTVNSIVKFESCDESGLCQVAYFFENGRFDTYFLEASYLAEKATLALSEVDRIFDSYLFD